MMTDTLRGDPEFPVCPECKDHHTNIGCIRFPEFHRNASLTDTLRDQIAADLTDLLDEFFGNLYGAPIEACRDVAFLATDLVMCDVPGVAAALRQAAAIEACVTLDDAPFACDVMWPRPGASEWIDRPRVLLDLLRAALLRV